MIDIQIQKDYLIEVIETINNEKFDVKFKMHVSIQQLKFVNGLEERNSEETQANNLLGLNSELSYAIKGSNHAKK